MEAIKSNLLALTNLVSPRHRNKQNGIPQWRRSRITAAIRRKKAFMMFKNSLGYPEYLWYIIERKRVHCTQRQC